MCAAGITPDDSTFRWAKRACTRASTVPEAEWCFKAMVDCGLVPDVGAYTAVVNVCAHVGDVAGAEKWFSAMHLAGIWPGAIAYNSVINAHAQAKDRAGAERWLSAMEASGIFPNDVTCVTPTMCAHGVLVFHFSTDTFDASPHARAAYTTCHGSAPHASPTVDSFARLFAVW